MYTPDERAADTPATLADRLRDDTTGELRDALLGQLHAAEDQVHASLADSAAAPGDADLLHGLLEAVRVSERSVVSAWTSFHGASASRSGSVRG